MEELTISDPTTISETGRIGVEQIDPKSTSEEAPLNDRDAFSASPTTSVNASVIHHDEEDDPHPGVLNEDVLESVFKHLINRSSSSRKQKRLDNTDILEDVRNIRLVCKTWKNVVTLLYRRAQAPTILHERKRLKSFLKVMKNSDMIPAQNYTVYINYEYVGNDTALELLKDFLLTCGSDIVSLSLDFSIKDYFVDKFHVQGLAGIKLEKLKKLKFYREVPGVCIGAFLGILLNSALEEFECKFGYSRTVPTKQFERIICRELPTTVKILHLSHIRLDEESIAALADTGLKLEEFQFDGSCFPGNGLAIRKFLENQTNTLKTLLIKGISISESTEFEFPRLNELLCLEMNGIQLKPFSITKTFPKLQTLDVQGWDERILVELLSYERVVLSVKEVIMLVSRNSVALPKTISEHFPNITTLRISPPIFYYLDVTETLQEVFIHFPNIEQLEVCTDVENTDSLFSGVSEAACERIWKESNFAEVNLMNEQSMPSILNLTKLKKLVVINGLGRSILTDISAHFVFLQMPNLKELSLLFAKISPTYVELLENKLDLEITHNYFRDGHNDRSDSEDEED